MPARKKNPTRPARPSRSANELRRVSRSLRQYALFFPDATEDFPWGERVVKVKGKVFVFLGADPAPGGPMGLSIKLPESGRDALDLPFTRPTGYGLGKSGWVTATFQAKDRPPVEILRAWIRESYCAVAPKKLAAELESFRVKTPGRRPHEDRRG